MSWAASHARDGPTITAAGESRPADSRAFFRLGTALPLFDQGGRSQGRWNEASGRTFLETAYLTSKTRFAVAARAAFSHGDDEFPRALPR